jgi:hypothetical protein
VETRVRRGTKAAVTIHRRARPPNVEETQFHGSWMEVSRWKATANPAAVIPQKEARSVIEAARVHRSRRRARRTTLMIFPSGVIR